MAKNKIYYMLLGIGIGILLTSAMNIVFNKPKAVEYTDEQIKEKAKSLGMISIKENIEKKEHEKDEKIEKATDEIEADKEKQIRIQQELEQTRLETIGETSGDKKTAEAEKIKKAEQTKLEKKPEAREGYKSIEIENGDNGNDVMIKLREEGLIDASDNFIILVKRYKLDTKFTSGIHDINTQASDRDIIEKLIQQKDLREVGFYK